MITVIRTLSNPILTNMLCLIFLGLFINIIICKGDSKVVILDEGGVQGQKYWNGEFYEFYGVPYATVPKGRNRFQAPLPAESWSGVITANSRSSRCYQAYSTAAEDEEALVDGEEDCLVMNLFVPKVANETNLVPVVVYIHSGAFSGGNGNMAQFHYLARHDIIVISFNYRLGALGFACLGNKEVPGNAGMKDQVAALRWINKNVSKFGGDPKKVTVAGFSVGAAMAELIALSDTTNGLIDKLILESGSALSPFAINRDPVETARNIAISIGYKDTGSLRDLTEFYLNSTLKKLASKSQNFFLPNSTFGFAPCIENKQEGIEAFLTESPMDIFRRGINKQIAILTGFANMEGLSRSVKFDEWSEKMNEKFDDFLPADLKFVDAISKESFIQKVKQKYFKGEEVTHDTLQGYIDYFSDSMFKYSILKSVKGHVDNTKRPVYLYEFSYVGDLNMKHYFMDKIKGASHRDQTAYILDFFGWTNKLSDLDTRDRMTMMWSDFVKYENPTAYESILTDFQWPKFTNAHRKYLQIDEELNVSKDLFEDGYKFWNEIYDKYYWNPKPPKIVVEEPAQENKVINKEGKTVNEPSKKIDAEPESDNDSKEKVNYPEIVEETPNTIYVNDPKKSKERKINTSGPSKETGPSSATNKITKTEL